MFRYTVVSSNGEIKSVFILLFIQIESRYNKPKLLCTILELLNINIIQQIFSNFISVLDCYAITSSTGSCTRSLIKAGVPNGVQGGPLGGQWKFKKGILKRYIKGSVSRVYWGSMIRNDGMEDGKISRIFRKISFKLEQLYLGFAPKWIYFHFKSK